MERSGNFYKAIQLGYILISILIGCMALICTPKVRQKTFWGAYHIVVSTRKYFSEYAHLFV